MDHDKIYFDFHTPTETIKDFVWEIPGIHNVENATVALAILTI
jgi:UDP-N-acetylmuramate--alanine ligase